MGEGPPGGGERPYWRAVSFVLLALSLVGLALTGNALRPLPRGGGGGPRWVPVLFTTELAPFHAALHGGLAARFRRRRMGHGLGRGGRAGGERAVRGRSGRPASAGGKGEPESVQRAAA